jgi:hypothetical protein
MGIILLWSSYCSGVTIIDFSKKSAAVEAKTWSFASRNERQRDKTPAGWLRSS